jgi:hypothetical protein
MYSRQHLVILSWMDFQSTMTTEHSLFRDVDGMIQGDNRRFHTTNRDRLSPRYDEWFQLSAVLVLVAKPTEESPQQSSGAAQAGQHFPDFLPERCKFSSRLRKLASQ